MEVFCYANAIGFVFAHLIFACLLMYTLSLSASEGFLCSKLMPILSCGLYHPHLLYSTSLLVNLIPFQMRQ